MKTAEQWANEIKGEAPLMFHISLIQEIQEDVAQHYAAPKAIQVGKDYVYNYEKSSPIEQAAFMAGWRNHKQITEFANTTIDQECQ